MVEVFREENWEVGCIMGLHMDKHLSHPVEVYLTGKDKGVYCWRSDVKLYLPASAPTRNATLPESVDLSQTVNSASIEIPPPLFNLDVDGTILGVLQQDAIDNFLASQNSLNDSMEDFVIEENGCFASISEQELVNLEKASKADSTHKNTRWAPKLFKGKYILLLYYYYKN